MIRCSVAEHNSSMLSHASIAAIASSSNVSILPKFGDATPALDVAGYRARVLPLRDWGEAVKYGHQFKFRFGNLQQALHRGVVRNRHH